MTGPHLLVRPASACRIVALGDFVSAVGEMEQNLLDVSFPPCSPVADEAMFERHASTSEVHSSIELDIKKQPCSWVQTTASKTPAPSSGSERQDFTLPQLPLTLIRKIHLAPRQSLGVNGTWLWVLVRGPIPSSSMHRFLLSRLPDRRHVH